MRSNRSIPGATVIPELAYPDVGEAIDWLCDTFGFTLRLRIANHRAQLNIGDGAVVVTQQRRRAEGATSPNVDTAHAVMVRVDDVDGHHARASQRGAQVIDSPTSYPYGERQYSVVDFAGHGWTFTQSIDDVAPEDWGGTPGQL
jgi:uncharacterized glyoxalase superfamily protein PhnB